MMHPYMRRLLSLLYGFDQTQLHEPDDRCPICDRRRGHDKAEHRRQFVYGLAGVTLFVLVLGLVGGALR